MSAQLFSEQFSRFTAGLSQKYEPPVCEHLRQVYMVLACATGATAVGGVLQMMQILNLAGIAAICSFFLVLGLHFYKDDGKNYNTRFGMLLAFGFCSGHAMGPLLQYVANVDSSIIFTALTGTTIIFISLSLAALFAENGKYLFLGGILVSIINTMAIVTLVNIFFQIHIIQLAQLYGGVFLMGAFVLYDTQNMVEKCRAGNRDVIQHALDLFFNIISIFRRLLIILTQKEERKREERKRR